MLRLKPSLILILCQIPHAILGFSTSISPNRWQERIPLSLSTHKRHKKDTTTDPKCSKLLFQASSAHSNNDSNDMDVTSTISFNRRNFVFSSIMSFHLSQSLPSYAATTERMIDASMSQTNTKKPYAPIETLLPAVRVKQTIHEAVQLTKSILRKGEENVHLNKNEPNDDIMVAQLRKLILEPQNYIQSSLKLQGVPSKPANLYLDSYKGMKGDLPFQTFLIKNGDVMTWKKLKRKEKEKEQSSEILASLNAYTDNLSFSSEQYLLNVDRKTKSTMIREDRLPDMKQVITSDMGLRYLYRNQVLTAMDDVKAEMEYQTFKRSNNNTDDTDGADYRELLDLLLVAENALDRWFSLIDPQDVQSAIETLGNENTYSAQ